MQGITSRGGLSTGDCTPKEYELAELRQLQNFIVDFRLTDDGDLELQGFGERSLDDIWDWAFPVLSQTMLSAADEETLSGTGKKKGKLADTELGKSV
ncbi:hypothetical protein SBA4_4190006 [Candidatus Sulfopaludibacter sp. SbA4]|nr:hypothetical protein SBA4_4190006 [Candidatus Sulfopaludibacter sp. SbA4]